MNYSNLSFFLFSFFLKETNAGRKLKNLSENSQMNFREKACCNLVPVLNLFIVFEKLRLFFF
nr:hypothetical protein PU94_06695 [Coprobacter secundus]